MIGIVVFIIIIVIIFWYYNTTEYFSLINYPRVNFTNGLTYFPSSEKAYNTTDNNELNRPYYEQNYLPNIIVERKTADPIRFCNSTPRIGLLPHYDTNPYNFTEF